jgi:hypothetical protein
MRRSLVGWSLEKDREVADLIYGSVLFAKSMNVRQKVRGSVIGFIGFMLSPLSWWNDLFVNVPLAVGFAWVVAWFYPPLFKPAVVVGYWATNVLGFVLLHLGVRRLAGTNPLRPYGWAEVRRDLLVSLAYTLLIVVLLKLGVLKPLEDFLPTSAAQSR